ncbi:iron complex transport system substrate-binding protein [Sinobaca qinghaiensis]|uniref:Iron complex transport system substrate-binding protein n=2 Tax=Sinobaca qinghaiensis TaxID=342944 RepID=A0A419UWJ6_9BACL|nr:iron complex transport system substrate-binding protein [Sinobaca qinghaiensis]
MYMLKKWTTAPGFLLCLAFFLSACGSSSEGNSDAGENEQAEESGSDTRTVTAENGEVEIPADPERVIALQFAGDLLALGIEPIGVDSTIKNNSEQLEEELADAEDVGDPSVEKVLEMEPDLIVAPTYLEENVISQLEQIAPTVTAPWAEMDAKEEVAYFGEMLGREEEADEWIASYEQQAEDAKEQISGIIESGETVGVYELSAKEIYVHTTPGRGSYNLYETLDLPAPDLVQEEVLDPGEQFAALSLETLPDYAADHMFVTVYEEGGVEEAEQLMESSIWKSLPAYQNDQIYMVPLEKFWFNDGVSLERQLDIQVEELTSGE